MRIVLGSTSEHKLEAVREACEKLGIKAEVSGVKTSSGQNEQPFGLDETYNGALTRANSVREKNPDSVCIGIESGVITFGSSFIDLAVIVLYVQNRRIVATSSGIEFPQAYVRIAEKRGNTTTVGSVIAETLGCDGTDPHSALTRGKVSRKDMLVQALMIALSQL